MWELIRANRRRSAVLMLGMLALLLALGFLIGSAVAPSLAATEHTRGHTQLHYVFDPTAGLIGVAVAAFLWLFQATLAYFQGDSILLAVSRARQIEKADHPQLYNVVEEMTIAASLPKMPGVYVIEDMSMNAFATGRSPERASVAVTAGLLANANRDQLQGVIAHEISHIVHRDVLFMTLAGVMVGSIIMLSDLFLRSLRFGGAHRYRSNSRRGGGGGAQAILFVAAIVLAIIAPILAQFLYFACSRRREYLADAGAAVYTRYPEGLASALEMLEQGNTPLETANRATAPMYIVNPFDSGAQAAFGLTSTHPPIRERVRILRSMAGGVSFQAYQSAWAAAKGHGEARMPASALQEAPVAVREGQAQGVQPTPRERMREAGDLLRKVNQFVFLACVCGVRIKLPPDFKRKNVQCPRCGHVLDVSMPPNPESNPAGRVPPEIPMARVRKDAPPPR